MKNNFQIIIIFLGLVVGLTTCQSVNKNQFSCEPASNPFDDNSLMMASGEYTGGMYPNITISRACKFSGQLVKGQTFKQKITQGLAFCLKPNKYDGWTIVMTDSIQSDCDKTFSSDITPPWHGENDLYIYGYQFRNKDNTGENDGSVNAPQKVREFNFLLKKDDYETIQTYPRCWYYGFDCPNDMNWKFEHSRGIMTINDLELGNLIPNEKAQIDSIGFEVIIYLPAE